MVTKSTMRIGKLSKKHKEIIDRWDWSMFIISWEPIVKYIKDQHSAYLRKELTAQRDRYITDTRVHCCLFFITPSGHS